MPQPPLADIPHSKISKKNIIIVASAFFAMLIIAVVFFLLANNPVNTFKQALERNDIAAAAVLYNEKLTDKDKATIQPMISELITQVTSEYINNTLAFDVANEKLQQLVALTSLGNVEIFEAQESIKRIENSRTAYIQGMDEIANKNYESAIQLLSSVIELDTNYPQAQQAIEQAKSQYIVASLKEADSLATEELFSEAKTVIDTALLAFPTDEALLQEQQMYVDLIDEQQREIARKKQEAEEQLKREAEKREQEALEKKKKQEERDKAYFEKQRAEMLELAENTKYEQLVGADGFASVDKDGGVSVSVFSNKYEVGAFSPPTVSLLLYDEDGQPLTDGRHEQYGLSTHRISKIDDEYTLYRVGYSIEPSEVGRIKIRACVSAFTYIPQYTREPVDGFNEYHSAWQYLYANQPYILE